MPRAKIWNLSTMHARAFHSSRLHTSNLSIEPHYSHEMDARHASAAEKAALFNALRTTAPDDEFDSSEIKNRQRSRGFFRSQETSIHEGPREQLRRASAPTPGKQIHDANIIKSTPKSAMGKRGRLNAMLNGVPSSVDDAVVPDSTRALHRSESTPLPAAKRPLGTSNIDTPSRPPAGSKRRKRNSSPIQRPEEECIFKDLAFFYVPDNDIAPARRIRISKAREYGATWTRMVSAATHIVVDRSIQYKDLNGILARTNKSRPPKVVSEDYPIDCIQFRAILDHQQRKYHVTGQPLPEKETAAETPPSSEDSTRSLPLKAPQINPKRWDYVPPSGTPQRSEESSQASRVEGTPAPTDSQPIALDLAVITSSPQAEAPAVPSSQQEEGQVRRGSGDELSDYITMMQKYKDLPLDRDEEDDSRSVAGNKEVISYEEENSGSDEERAHKERSQRTTSRAGRKDMRFEERFACNTGGSKDTHAQNPNARTIEILQSMADYYDRVNDQWRPMAYRKAINTLKRQEVKITTEEEAFRLPMIGQRLAQKIEEIVTTDRLRRLECAEAEPMHESLQLFMQIYGVGRKQAHQWIAQGLRTLDDLKRKAKLSTNQLIGVEHYYDLIQRIPRREVEALGVVVQKAAARIDPKVQLVIGGSYRRGAETSHDIDFIVTKPDTTSSGEILPFLGQLVHRLEQDKFLVARLASSRPGHDGSKWHGCCILPRVKGLNDNADYKPTWRRIDFLLVPESEMGAALIYFTGNDIFNRSMRLLASRKGMRLNQRGLYKDVLRAPGRTKLTERELVEGRDERRIFEILGVQWREPHERWC